MWSVCVCVHVLLEVGGMQAHCPGLRVSERLCCHACSSLSTHTLISTPPFPCLSSNPFLNSIKTTHQQVCNHPELFEGQAERWPLTFAQRTTALSEAHEAAAAAAAPVMQALPGRQPRAPPGGPPWVQVTGFRSHVEVSSVRVRLLGFSSGYSVCARVGCY